MDNHWNTRKGSHRGQLKMGAGEGGLKNIISPSNFAKDEHYYTFFRPEISSMIDGKPERILEVGCAEGMMGGMVKESFDCEYIGIEINENAARKASTKLDRVIAADIEKTNLGQCGIDRNSLDYVVYGDVLEHLYDPWNVLNEHHQYIKDDGYIILSIPNIRNLKIIESLVNGHWSYQDAGILDITHLRFFTLSEVKKMLIGCGYDVLEIKYLIQNNFDIGQMDGPVSLDMPKLVIKNVTRQEMLEFASEQFVIKASKRRSKTQRVENDHASGEGSCSIVIPILNKIHLTLQCLEAIRNNTSKGDVEIIVVDNGSTDGSADILKQRFPKINIIQNQTNLGFAKACNQGVDAAAGQYVLFLNNDTMVEKGWLDPLISIMENDSRVAAVGSKLLFPDRTIQHAGVVMVENRKVNDPLAANHVYYRQPENYAEANIPHLYQALTAACLLVRRSAFEAVGGYDDHFWNAYEDVDLCFKLREKGWLLVYEPRSVVIHFESQSGPERFSKIRENIDRLHQKWVDKVSPDLVMDESGKTHPTHKTDIGPYLNKSADRLPSSAPTTECQPVTSIVILACNQLAYTKKCIDSILQHTQSPFELVVVDNGSQDGTSEYLRSLCRHPLLNNKIQIIQNEDNLGFATGNNQGIAAASGDYILLLNNDIVVTPNWLERLTACAQRHPKCGMVGPTSNNVSGPQQISHVEYNLETLEGLDRFAAHIAEQYAGKDRRLLRVVGFCMLIKKDVIDRIGGLDGLYGLGNFEDDDFSLRAALAGFESWMAADCFVHHFGGRTFIGEKIDYSDSLLKNWQIFKTKWGLPADLPYGSGYRLDQVSVRRFDPSVHYVALNQPTDLRHHQNQNMPEKITAATDREQRAERRPLKERNATDDIARLKSLVAAEPDNATAHNDLGVLYFLAGDADASQKHYEKATRLDPTNTTFKKNYADFLCVAKGRLEDALAHYVDLLQANPQDVEVLTAMAEICAATEQWDDAAYFYDSVLAFEPENTDAQKKLYRINQRRMSGQQSESPQARYQALLDESRQTPAEEAIRRLQSFLMDFPEYAVCHNDLGALYQCRGDHENALHHYHRATQIEPENDGFQRNLADYLFSELNRIDDALVVYRQILSRNPQDVDLLMMVGHLCVAQNKFKEAEDCYRQVLKLYPDHPDAGNYMAATRGKSAQNSVESDRAVARLDTGIRSTKSDPKYRNSTAVHSTQQGGALLSSIIILLDGAHHRIKRCLKNIEANTATLYEVLLVGYRSKKNVLNWAQQQSSQKSHLHLLESNADESMADALNRAVSQANGEIIVLLHHDVVVGEGWLEDITAVFGQTDNVGVVGPMTNLGQGPYSPPAIDVSIEAFQKRAADFRKTYRHRRMPAEWLNSACVAFDAKLIDKTGPFDPNYRTDDFMVKDFCVRAALVGFQNVVAGGVLMYHENSQGRMSSATAAAESRNTDWAAFEAKWNGFEAEGPVSQAREVNRIIEKGCKLFRKERISAAVDYFLQGIGTFPDSGKLYYELANQLKNLGKFQQALETIAEMPDSDAHTPVNDIAVTVLKGYCEEGLGNDDKAEAYLKKSLNIDDTDAPALNLYGILAYKRGDVHTAEACFRQAMESDPGYGEAFTNLGAMHWDLGEKKPAFELLQKGFVLNPLDAEITSMFHSALTELGGYDQVEDIARDAALLHPDSKKLQYLLIDVLNRQQKYPEAMAVIEKAIALFGIDDGILPAALSIRQNLGPMTINTAKQSRPTVSLCMIVKDEERDLPRCLHSVKPIVDEMIVVDTGSSDRTKDIAAVFGAAVHEFEWINDFAAARNHSLSKAGGDWILIMDADEAISPQDHEAFGKIVSKRPKSPQAYMITTRNYNTAANILGWIPNSGKYTDEEAGTGWLPSHKVRLFTRDDRIRFEGKVHEMVDPVLLKAGVKSKPCRIPVHHYGRMNQEKLNQKGEIYYRIGLEKLDQTGDDVCSLRELATQAGNLHHSQEAIDLWQRFLKLQLSPALKAEALVNMGTAHSRLGQYEQALDCARKAIDADPDMKEAHYNYAMAALHLNDADTAVSVLEALLERVPEYPPALFIKTAAYGCNGQLTHFCDGIRQLKGTAMAKGLVYSVIDLIKGLMAADNDLYARNLLQASMDHKIVNKELLELYAQLATSNSTAVDALHDGNETVGIARVGT